MTAEERAMELMKVPQNKLPEEAWLYARQLCSKYGGCGEVYITAFAHYAQAIEGLTCSDSLYLINKDGEEFFKL